MAVNTDQWAGDCTELFKALPAVQALLANSQDEEQEKRQGATPYSRPVYGI